MQVFVSGFLLTQRLANGVAKLGEVAEGFPESQLEAFDLRERGFESGFGFG